MFVRRLMLMAALGVLALAPTVGAQDRGRRDRAPGVGDRAPARAPAGDRAPVGRRAITPLYNGRITRIDTAAREIVINPVATPAPGRPGTGTVAPSAPGGTAPVRRPPITAAPPTTTGRPATPAPSRPGAPATGRPTPGTGTALTPPGAGPAATGGRPMTFRVTKDARITLDGRKATLKDLHKDLFVRIHGMTTEAGTRTGTPAKTPAKTNWVEAYTRGPTAGTGTGAGTGTIPPPARRP